MKYGYDSGAVRYIGRWGRYREGMAATACGSQMEVAFRGRGAVLHFDPTDSLTPSHFYIQVDGGARVETVADYTVHIRCAEDGEHVVRVMLKSGGEIQNRWEFPLQCKIHFLSFEADGEGTLPPVTKKRIELIGDSITEGILVEVDSPYPDGDDRSRPYYDDFTETYGAMIADALGLEPLPGAYGAVGVTHGGNGGVPRAADMYDYCFEGCPVSYEPVDYVLINHGTNDAWQEAHIQQFAACYRELLDRIVARNPHARIAAIIPFYGCFADELRALIPAYNREKGTSVLLIDTTGWLPQEPIHPLYAGHRLAAERILPTLRRAWGL